MVVALLAQAHAATFVVDDSGGAQFTAIQPAIAAASSGDLIEVREGTYPGAIDFLGKDLEVRGAGEGLTIVDPAGSVVDAIRITSGEGPGAVLSHLTVRNADQRGAYVIASSPTFDHVTFDNLGRDTTGLFNGGGAFVSGGSPWFDACTFTGNAGYLGGDVHVTGAAEVTITDSVSTLAVANSGGSVYVASGSVVLDGVTLESGDVANDGGAVYLSPGTSLEAIDSSFLANHADSDGGAVAAVGATFDDLRGNYQDNEANRGAGLWVTQSTVLTLDRTLLYSNVVVYDAPWTYADEGGGIFADASTVSATSATFWGNSSGKGGAVYATGSTGSYTDVDGWYESNGASGCSPSYSCYGAGGYITSPATFAGTMVLTNHAGAGGGLYLGGTSVLDRVVFERNDANDAGGALYLGGTVTIRDSVFDRNAHDYYGTGGGAIYASAHVTIERSRFTDNTASYSTSVLGGAIHQTSGTLLMSDLSFERNVSGSGGAIYYNYESSSGRLEARRVRFVDNTALRSGGAIYVDGPGTFLVADSMFEGNGSDGSTSSQRGGAIYSQDVDRATIVGNRFCANTAYDGGAIYETGGDGVALGDSEWTNNAFAENTAVQWGGAMYANSAWVRLLNNSFGGNAAFTAGGSAYLLGTGGEVRNNVFAYTLAGDAAQGTTTATFSYNAWYQNLGADAGGSLTTAEAYGPGTLFADPGFRAWSSNGLCDDDLLPAAGSALIGAGDPAFPDWDGSSADIGWSGGADSALRDVDGDGWIVADDCHDGDATVNPGEAETWYDGVDQDCGFDDDFDQDADGETVERDCDDLDPTETSAEDDLDGDGLCFADDLCDGDNATLDVDGDGLCGDVDLCFGDDATRDTDNDGICGSDDVCPGWDDAVPDADTDGDGFTDHCGDNCRYYPNPAQADADADTLGDVCDVPTYGSCSSANPLDLSAELSWPTLSLNGWEFGARAPNGAYAPFGTTSVVNGVQFWQQAPGNNAFPRVGRCSRAANCQIGPALFPVGTVVLHPSPTLDAAVRYRNAYDETMTLDLDFRAADLNGTPASANVEVRVDGQIVFTDTIDGLFNSAGGGNLASATLPLALHGGSMIEIFLDSRGATNMTDGVILTAYGTCL